MKIAKSKRFRYAIIIIAINMILGLLGVLQGVNLAMLGYGLAMVNSPFFLFIVGDAIRPAKDSKKGLIPISKRLKFSAVMLAINYAIYTVAILTTPDSEMYNIAVFLSMVNSPLYAYILGDSFRKVEVQSEYVSTGRPDISIEILKGERYDSQD